MTPPPLLSSRATGLSVVELMVGLAIGLVVITLSIAVMAQQASASRRLLAEARLTHELRSSVQLISRHLRRAGHWADAHAGVARGDVPAPAANPHGEATAMPDGLAFSYSSPAGGAPAEAAPNHHFGFRLRDGVLQMQLGEGRWQALTDPAVLRVTTLSLVPRPVDRPLPMVCGGPCAAGVPQCPPRVRTLQLDVHLEAVSPRHPEVQRRLDTRVRARNDVLVGRCVP